MAYSDFTLKKVKLDFNIQTVEDQSLFSNSEEIKISDYLAQTLKRNVPLALAINTEKARSELIIINILLEVKEKSYDQKISLFSGIDFNVDKEKGLTGFCDYIISGSEEQLYLELPVITIVEAKNENIISGLGQCIAEMYAAQLFNQEASYELPCVYGAVTTGDEWRFIKLEKNVAYIDNDNYYINNINKIIGILVNMVKGEA
ncbi:MULTISPECIES: hypothetical protein [unclassified Moorena]|uniref:hypothetical protein n=1 Tax=unclassified Moorena TaxID=2683338 RepID=UPI0014010867|nr:MULTISPECIES: hypothetical protein [unclassified Moorena]NEO13103.1 hypothetical protein [Moorena sp. SIO3E8]NEP98121.1 hypothetical protein [Moorena sp. SIO3F7]